MYLWKVTVFCKKHWMTEYKELTWATCADTADGAIEQIIDSHDLSGVEIEKTVAKRIDENYLVLNVGF